MKKIAMVVLALGLVVNVAHAKKKSGGGDKASIEKALIANEQAINDAVAKGDAQGFLSHIVEGGFSGDAHGFATAADFAKAFGQIKLTEAKVGDPKVTWASEDTAIVTYTWTGKGTMFGQPVPSPTYSSTVWTNRGGKWLAVYHQETQAAPPAAGK